MDTAERRVVRYDAEVQERRLDEILDALRLSLQQPAWREALGEAWLARLLPALDAARARLRQPFHLLVVGDFKRGKSTLINALLGRVLVTMDVAPETVVITELAWGPALRVEARLTDGGRVALRPEDLPGARLSAILAHLGPVDVVRVEAPLPLLEGVVVVDSPGMGDLLWRFDRRVAEYLPRADAVLHVLSALSPLSESERSFLTLSLRPQELVKVAFVLNQLDTMSPADGERVLARVRENLAAGFPDSPVFGLSALDELVRFTGEAVPAPERSAALGAAFGELRGWLEERVLLHRDVVLGERAVSEAERALSAAAAELRRMRGALDLDREALQAALIAARDQGSAARLGVAAREAELRQGVAGLGEQAAGWMAGLVDRLDAEALPALSALSHEEAQKHFPFFLAEALRDGLGACIDAHQDLLHALAEASSAAAAAELGAALGRAKGAVDEASGRAGWQAPAFTPYDQLHVVGMILGLFTGMIAPLFAGLLDRGLAEKARGESYRQRLRASIPELQEQVRAGTRKAYAELAERIAVRLREEQAAALDGLAAELQQAIGVHDRGAERIAATGAALDAAWARIDGAAAELAALRGRLREVAAT